MLKLVTLTGLDNKTDLREIYKLGKDYPFVEFGILVSKNNSNTDINNRYPNLSIISALKPAKLNLACHVCGSIARDIVNENKWDGVYDLLKKNFNTFQRFQLNVGSIDSFNKNIEFPENKTFILQVSNNRAFYDFYKDKSNIVCLHDKSGGTGKIETEFQSENKFTGYAGGISPENVEDIIKKINDTTDNDYWIDMESSIRTDDWLDIDKCKRVLDICSKYI